MDAKHKTALSKCRTPTEAAPIMEALKLRPTQRKLVETALQLSHSTDPRQKAIGEDFMMTVFRETDDDDKIKEDNGSAHRKQGGEEDVIDKVTEADEITGELDSHQSSDIDMPYPKEGTDAPQNDIESSKTASGENQMKEGMPMPGMMPQGPPMQQNGMPPIDPSLMGNMKPNLPPGLNPAMMKQMQYTVTEAMKTYVRPVVKEVKKLREAYVALDKKFQETESLRGGMRLDIDHIKKNSPVQVRETIDDLNIPVPSVDHSRFELQQAQDEINAMDKAISSKKSDIYN